MGWLSRLFRFDLYPTTTKHIAALPRGILWTLGGLLLVALLSSSIGFLGVHRMSGLIFTMMDENVPSVRAANELKISMLGQRGLVASFILDGGNRKWLEQIESSRQAFNQSLVDARASVHTDREKEILERVESASGTYNNARDQAIRFFELGQHDQAAEILVNQTPMLYEQAYRTCDELIAANVAYMNSAANRVQRTSDQLWWFTLLSVCCTIVLAGTLIVLLSGGVYLPLKRMAAEAKRLGPASGGQNSPDVSADDLSAVRQSLTYLAGEAASAQDRLTQSHDELRQAERMASVGKLTAGIAHEIRGLLTTMKLWSYSLQQTRFNDRNVQTTFEAMHEELERLEQLVRNFLEFARPPELKQGHYQVADLVDQATKLVQPRLEDKDLELCMQFDSELPPVLADAEQLKHVLVNLLTNACEASNATGRIVVAAALEDSDSPEKRIVIRFTNFGAPIPNNVQARVFEPFLTTKKHGVGLGLSIAAAIAQRHGGKLELLSSDESGTVFALCLPPYVESDDGKNFAG